MNIFDITPKDINLKKSKQFIPIYKEEIEESYILYFKEDRIEILQNKTKQELQDIVELRYIKPIAIFKTNTLIKLQKIKL